MAIVTSETSAAARDAARFGGVALYELGLPRPATSTGTPTTTATTTTNVPAPLLRPLTAVGRVRRTGGVHGLARSTDIALFLHTSGTTGKPKGPPIPPTPHPMHTHTSISTRTHKGLSKHMHTQAGGERDSHVCTH
jgi:acyl-CoA synthetase (AMP-forming)/AMP-acid ligase II